MTTAAVLQRKLRTAAANPALLIVRPKDALLRALIRNAVKVPAVSAWRDRLLATWLTPAARGAAGGLLFGAVFDQWIRDVYLREPDPDAREALKTRCMGGDSGVAWADSYDAHPFDRSERIGELSFDQAMPMFPALDALLPRAAPGTIVVQIGASSGREIAYLAARAPGISFIGTDIDTGITSRAARSHPLANLTFCVARAHTLFDDIHVPEAAPVVVISSGSLQYVQPEHLAVTFDRLVAWGTQATGARILLVESVRDDGRSPDRLGGSAWRGNFSYTHDYKHYAERAGMRTVEHAIVRTDTDPASPHFHTRSYFYHGVAGDLQ